MSKHPKFEEFVASFPEVALDENQRAIIHERSLTLPNGEKETWRQVARRVALAAAKDTANYANDTRTVEDDAIDFFKIIYPLKMISATPVLLNAGTPYQQLFSCFATVVKDDMKEQFDLKYTAAKIFEMSAGIGYNFSYVRSKDSIVGKNGALAYGVIALMYALHVNCEMIKTGSVGRRGAQLAALDVYHPEILKFVSCKQNEKHFKSFNISVIIDKNFLDAVKEDKMITCRTWKDERPPKYSARRLWNKLVTGGWLNGEPGILFMDNANEGSPISHFGRIESTNPSLRWNTRVLTDKGAFRIKDLSESNIIVKNLDGQMSNASCFLSGKDKRLYKITLESGKSIYCTPEHKWPVYGKDGIHKVETKDITVGSLLPLSKTDCISNGSLGNEDDGFFCGFMLADGWVITRNDNGKQQIGICVSEEKYASGIGEKIINTLRKNDLSDAELSYRTRTYPNGRVSNWYELNTQNDKIMEYIGKFGFDGSKNSLPDKLFNECSEAFRRGFIDGLVSADGHVAKNPVNNKGITITQKSKNLLLDLSDLLDFYGIKHAISTFTTDKISFPNGKNYNKSYTRNDISIKTYTAIERFKSLFSLTNKHKQGRLDKIVRIRTKNSEYQNIKSNYTKIVNIEMTDLHEDVYDISVYDQTHCFHIAGCVTGNCGEIPTVDYGSCNLGSINLLQCMNAEGNDLDYVVFEDVIRKTTRLLDNLISVNDFPDKKFKKVEEHIRSIGISVMGFADLLIKMKIPYDSEEGQAVADKISEFRQRIALDESEKIAAVRGVAPVFLPENGAPENAPKRRNAFVTTQAPTGSVSMIANCSPSMEPIFGLTMTKKCLDGKTFKYINPDFAAFLKTKHISDEHMKIITDHVYACGSLKNLPDLVKDDMIIEYWSPEEVRHFVTAHDIHYRDRLKMQAVFQKHTDQAISSTVNLPESATKEDVADMIVMAHELGLKGICCYRSGSRKNQVLNVGDPNKNSWLCLHCGKVNVEDDPTIDPTKVCIKCQHCGAASCASQK
jgi:ribonucleoside-diphosphate reductase alpha chain